MNKFVEIPGGTIFGRLTVISCFGVVKERRIYNVICICGTERLVPAHALKSGNTTSCGCWARELATKNATSHGLRFHPLFRTWEAMMARCNNPKSEGYPLYGGRGISVCERWRIPSNFMEDMGPKPEPTMELDRINNNGNYEPSNVRWATKKTNMRNTRVNVVIEYEGKSRLLIELAEEKGFNIDTLRKRFRRGDVDLFRPIGKGCRTVLKKRDLPAIIASVTGAKDAKEGAK